MNRPVHWEIPSTNVRKSSEFYTALFGWQASGVSDSYAMLAVDGGVGGGIVRVERMPGPGVDVYFGVDDIPATLERVTGLGGTPVVPKSEIAPGRGFWAAFLDPCGCRIGIWSAT